MPNPVVPSRQKRLQKGPCQQFHCIVHVKNLVLPLFRGLWEVGHSTSGDVGSLGGQSLPCEAWTPICENVYGPQQREAEQETLLSLCHAAVCTGDYHHL